MMPKLSSLNIENILKLSLCLAYLMLYQGASNAAQCFLFNVDIQGTGSIGNTNATAAPQAFRTSHFLYARVPGIRSNPVDFILDSGKNLNASGQLGDIKLMSNSLSAENAGIRSTLTDMASVISSQDETGTYLQFQINTDASFILPPANTMVTPGVGDTSGGGLGGICFLPGFTGFCQDLSGSQILNSTFMIPRTGGGYFLSKDGTWQNFYGLIQLSGSSPDNPNFIGYYQAELWGQFVRGEEC